MAIDAVTTILVFAQAISTLSAAGVAIVLWVGKAKAPNQKQNERLDKLESDMVFVKTCLDNDNKRLDKQDEGNRVTQKAILALMSHAINGNDTDKLVEARDKLQEYLIER